MPEIIIALDHPRLDAALDLVDRVGEAVSFYKVGPVLYTRTGPSVLRELKDRGKRIFLDLKVHDIPNTVAGTVEAAAELRVQLLTVHVTGGAAMMRAAAAAAGEDGPRLLGVTLLTSFTPAEVEQVWGKQLQSVREETLRLTALAAESGLHGVVTSALEAEAVRRRQGPEFLVVTPGIRPAGERAGDQARTATPAEAARAGADYLVIGRPVTAAADPAAAVASIRAELEGVRGAAG